jgi:hypothetical protein
MQPIHGMNHFTALIAQDSTNSDAYYKRALLRFYYPFSESYEKHLHDIDKVLVLAQHHFQAYLLKARISESKAIREGMMASSSFFRCDEPYRETYQPINIFEVEKVIYLTEKALQINPDFEEAKTFMEEIKTRFYYQRYLDWKASRD